MLKVLEITNQNRIPQSLTVKVVLSDGREFTVTDHSGKLELQGVPNKTDELFWNEWHRYIEVTLGIAGDVSVQELEAYQINSEFGPF